MSRGRLLLLLVMGSLVGAFFAFDLDAYFSLPRLQAHQEQASAWVQAHFGQAALLFTLLYVITTALSLPGAALLTLGDQKIGAIFLNAAATPFMHLGGDQGAQGESPAVLRQTGIYLTEDGKAGTVQQIDLRV